MPDHTKDPVVLAAQTVLALQTIVSREVSPLDPTVITVGSIHGGTKRNVIARRRHAAADGTHLQKDVRAKRAGGHPARDTRTASPPVCPRSDADRDHLGTEHGDALYNDPALTARVGPRVGSAFGKTASSQIPPEMVSEDVGHFGLDGQIPVLQFRVGAVAPAPRRVTRERQAAAGAAFRAVRARPGARDPQRRQGDDAGRARPDEPVASAGLPRRG